MVLANIERLLDAGVAVGIRLNMDNHNAENLMLLADELHERFAGRKRFFVYSHTLFEFSGNLSARVRAEEERRQLYEKQTQLRQKLAEYGIEQKHGLTKDTRLNHCMADSGNSLTILPDGQLGLCEHYTENNLVGHLDSEELDTAMVQSFRECWEQTEDCKTCFYYPECIRLKKCAEYKECFPETRKEYREQLLGGMLNAYAAWQKKEETDEEKTAPVC